jgi:large subunit ribosomal protein L18
MRITKDIQRKKRHLRLRKKISGSGERPRLFVFKSSKHFYASLINDQEHTCKIITTVSTLSKEFKSLSANGEKGWNTKGAILIGKLIAEKAKILNIDKVVFDRGGFQYIGKIKAFADAARQGGLKF